MEEGPPHAGIPAETLKLIGRLGNWIAIEAPSGYLDSALYAFGSKEEPYYLYLVNGVGAAPGCMEWTIGKPFEGGLICLCDLATAQALKGGTLASPEVLEYKGKKYNLVIWYVERTRTPTARLLEIRD